MRIINDLVKLDKTDYDACLKKSVEVLSHLSYVRSIYLFGTLNFPGISDIDLMIVLDSLNNYSTNSKEIKRVIAALPDSDFYYHHEPIVVAEEDLTYVNLFHSLENPSLLYGPDVLAKNKDINFGLEQVLTWNSYFYQAFWTLSQTKRPISLRYILLLLNNLAYSIRNNDQTSRSNFYPSYKDKVTSLRNNCLYSQNKIKDITKTASSLLQEGLSIINQQENKIQSSTSKRRWIFDWKNRNIFISNNELKFVNLKLLHIWFFPERYFVAREQVMARARQFKANDYFSLRERFVSVKILDF